MSGDLCWNSPINKHANESPFPENISWLNQSHAKNEIWLKNVKIKNPGTCALHKIIFDGAHVFKNAKKYF